MSSTIGPGAEDVLLAEEVRGLDPDDLYGEVLAEGLSGLDRGLVAAPTGGS